MPRKIAPLSDIECRNAKPREKLYKMADGGGLYLEVSPTGGKHWRMKYYFGGREKLLTIGPYPRVGLAAARKSREAAKDQIDAGLDPSGERKAQRLTAKLAANTTFEGVTREWFEREKQTWVESHATRILRRFERDIFPHIGNRPIAALTTPEVLAVLRKIEERGAVETAHRAKWDCSQVFLYAIETGRAERNPVVARRVKLGHFAQGKSEPLFRTVCLFRAKADDAFEGTVDADPCAQGPRAVAARDRATAGRLS